MNRSPLRQKLKSQTQNFENEPVMLSCLHKNACHQAKSPVIETGRQVSVLTSVWEYMCAFVNRTRPIIAV